MTDGDDMAAEKTRSVADVEPLSADSGRVFNSSWSKTRSLVEPGADHSALPAGYGLCEYSIEALLGSGGFGLTYLARDDNLQCQVAIKEYLPQELAIRIDGQTVCPRSQEWSADYEAGRKRFLAEARTLASFRHPNIVRITRFFEANGTAYMVMDYERGKSLREWRRNRVGAITEEDLLRMFLPLLDGLEVVHQGRVMHRDVKPANIYVREHDGSLVLLDFGSARQTQLAGTQGLTTIVTPGYAPFEQYHSHGVQGPWSDIYALGGVLYWLITGEKPLEAPARLKDDSMMPLRERARERFSRHFLAAIDWALQSDEKMRPHNVADFRAALTGQMEVPSFTSALVPAAAAPVVEIEAAEEKKPRRTLWAGMAAGLALAAAFAGWHFLGRPDKVAPQPAPQAAAQPATPPAPPPAPRPAAAPVPGPAPAADKPAAKAPAAKAEGAKAGKPPAKPEKPAAKKSTAPAPPTAGPVATAKLALKIVPYGDVYLDGKLVGKSPPLTEMPIPAGEHKLELRGDAIPYVAYYTVELKAGETRQIWFKFGD